MFRYAKNLANSHGLVWNIGNNPVEGATAFLWTILLSAFYKLGLAFSTSVPLINGLFLILTLILIYFSSLFLFKAEAIVGFIAVCVLATSPLVIQIRAGFETPMFSFFMALLTVCCVALIFCSDKIKKYCLHLIPLSGLILTLTRPEGVIFSSLSFLCCFLIINKKERLYFLKRLVLWFILPGTVYFIWRWHYFGYLFPNTFYAKAIIGKVPLPMLLWEGKGSLLWLGTFLAPYVCIICFYLSKIKDSLKLKIFVTAMPLFVFPISYLAIYQVQNVGYRFQISILPTYLVLFSIGLSSLYDTSPSSTSKWNKNLFILFSVGFIFIALFLAKRSTLISISLLLIISLYILNWLGIIAGFKAGQQEFLLSSLLILGILLTVVSFKITIGYREDKGIDDRIIIGKALKPFSSKGYVMLSSETGFLPFFSEWNAIDPAGLYDEYIAHHGLTLEYLDTIKPELIIFHAHSSTWTENMGGKVWGGKWNSMIQKMFKYANENNYLLAAIVQKNGPENVHWYYVKNDCPDKDEIIKAINDHENLVYSKKYPLQ